MKRFVFRLSVFLMTSLIGVGVFQAVCLGSSFVRSANETFVPNENSVLMPKDFENTKKLKHVETLPKFVPYGRGCGNGYMQSYFTPDGDWLTEGVQVFETNKEARREMNKWINQATQIIERVPKYKNRSGEFGQRIVIMNPPNDEGKESVSILWYGGDDSVTYIDALTLDLALEFEQSNAYAF